MKNLYVLLFLLSVTHQVSAQQTFSSGSLPIGYSDNASGTEIINTPAGQSVHFAPNGSFIPSGIFEHVGQFYIAANGVYDGSYYSGANGTDYFGYAPINIGKNNGPYLGSGIMGASPNNGGTGAGRPYFYNLVLTSTGLFPVAGGMVIVGKLTFGIANGSGSSIITVPDGKAVSFQGAATTEGANNANYIDGTVMCNANPESQVLFPVGDPQNTTHPYHPMTTVGMDPSTSARYLNTNPLPVGTATLGSGIGAVSTIGYWKINGLRTFTRVAVSIPQPSGLGASPNPANLRLVGWTGTKWVPLGSTGAVAPNTGSGSDLNGYVLSGGMDNHVPYSISALGIGTTEGAALPVRLTSFTGRYVENTGAVLTWETSMEINNDHFEIQRSSDAKSFESIGRVLGKRTTKALSQYSFTDAFMLEGTSYYRLKQVDLDGSYEFSSIIAVRSGADNGPSVLTLSPNPVQNSLNISLSNRGQIQEVRIHDTQGRILRQSTASVPEVSSLPAGNYLLDVRTTTGQSLRQRFIKQ